MIQNKALKRRIVEISYDLKLGHIGSCLTAVDIIAEIYKIKKPDEKFVLSAGHAHLAHLVVKEKYIREQEFKKKHTNAFFLEKIPDAKKLVEQYGIHCDRKAGCDVSTGSLGHGIGIAVGMALADRSKNVYCLLSDGEMAEGSVWEALRIINDQKINNIKLYVNWNDWSAYQESSKWILEHLLSDQTIKWMHTNMDAYPKWLQGQIAHYKVLNEGEYNELMELLK